MIKVRCLSCNKELVSTSKVQFCGCPNQMSVVDNKIGAKDLDKVVMVSNNKEKERLTVTSLGRNLGIKRSDVNAKFVNWILKLDK